MSRIKELAEQATKHYPATESSGEFSTFDKEKFALLIIEECMEQLNISNVPAPISAGLNLGRVAIKEHFGV